MPSSDPPSPKSLLPRAGRQRGLTFVEIVIVIAVLALVFGMMVVGFGGTRSAELARTVNQIANVIRYGYDKARVTGEHYRLRIDLEERSFALQQGDGRMYLPATDRDGEIIERDERKEEEREARDRRAEEAFNRSVQAEVFREGDDGEVGSYDPYRATRRRVPRRRPPMFDAFEEENVLSGLKDPFVLPEGMKITSVRTADDLQAITSGEASIYFFPRGRTQEAHILLEDERSDARYTIKLAPLTGRVTIEEGHQELKLPTDPSKTEDDLGRQQRRRTL
jgi:general secretion pathway protein H